jgi:methyltransferase (TIGR00027 family)
MREGLPSTTAAAVSLFRSLASLPGSKVDFANDAGMRALAPAPAKAALAALGQLTARRPGLHRVLAAPTFGLLDHVALRTAAIDAAIREERAQGLPQLVLLGAGLDARAFRMPELAETVVFEVDFPATQAMKQRRAAGLSPTAKELRWAAIDFTRDRLETVLARADHRTDRRTVWLWEGVTMYLPRAAMESTLEVIAERSLPGSSLLVTYATPELTRVLEGPLAPLEPLVHFGFGVLGEPIRERMTPETARDLLAAHHLRVESDTGSPEWAAAHFRGQPSRLVVGERLARAERI